jgi:hypothetical protein
MAWHWGGGGRPTYRNDWMPVRLVMSQTRIDLSSESLRIRSWRGWNSAHETLLKCPRHVSTSHARVSATQQQASRIKAGRRATGSQGSSNCRVLNHARALAVAGDHTVHAPQLDVAVVGGRDDQRQLGVEGCPVDAPVVALEDVLQNTHGTPHT